MWFVCSICVVFHDSIYSKQIRPYIQTDNLEGLNYFIRNETGIKTIIISRGVRSRVDWTCVRNQ
jgi:hypothetical protein